MEFVLTEGVEVLSRTPAALRGLLAGLTDPWLTNNEGPETWSPFDVVGHLLHGEKADWIPRAKIILARGEESDFEPFDRFAQENDSRGRTLEQLLDEFEDLRRSNLETLAGFGLTEREMGLTGKHPEFRNVTLKQLLATWVVHDLGHIVQITRTMAGQYTDEVGPWRKYLGVLGGTH